MRRFKGLGVLIVCLFVGSAGIYNVVSDNKHVERMAMRIACDDLKEEECNGRVTRMARNPFTQSFEIHTKKRAVDITCHRSAYLVGEYSCALR